MPDTATAAATVPRGPLFRLLSPLSPIILTLLLPLLPAAGQAIPPETTRMDDIGGGSLLLRTAEPGVWLRAPLLQTHVRMEINGTVGRVVVSQRFENRSNRWVEGVYVFPLPENAAVDHLRMRIGERYVEGRIQPREEARRIYEEARAAGQRAALMEQERPNMFTNQVANIGPGETVLVQIEYQQSLPWRDDMVSLRFPMVVAPRYIPDVPAVVADAGGGPLRLTPAVPDADRITPTVLHPDAGPANPVRIEVLLDAGFPLAGIDSPYHRITVTGEAGGRRRITLADGEVPADRDFVLQWRAAPGAAPTARLFAEQRDDGHYLLLTVAPPVGEADRPAPPRDIVFIIDTSGSMDGESIRQARDALVQALARLRPEDRFNVIRFSDTAKALFSGVRETTRETLDQAVRWVAGLEAAGGTEMMSALELALADPLAGDRHRQIIFLTDGAVGNETQLLSLIRRGLGARRLFTVGIGSAPNGWFMTRAAEFGRGSYTYIGDLSEIAARMTDLFRRIEAPVLTDIAISVEGAGADIWPRTVPDLYEGEPVVVSLRLPADAPAGLAATIRGRLDGEDWVTTLPLDSAGEGAGVAALWARRQIASLGDSVFEGANRDEVEARIVEVAMAHHLVSEYTSLVAVEVARTRPDDSGLERQNVPLNLPAGWNFESVFGQVPTRIETPDAPANPTRRAGASPAQAVGAMLAFLPQGATPATLQIAGGLTALLAGLALLLLPGLRARRASRARP